MSETAMLEDAYGNPVSTASAAARDAYAEGCDLMFRSWPGALAAFDRAIAADPRFALAHAGRARALQVADPAAARTAIGEAGALTDGLSPREASHVAVFALLVAGRVPEAYAAVRTHLAAWPRDAMVANPACTQSGLIGLSGRPGRDQEQADFLAWLQPHYGHDWWFEAHYGMALSEARRPAQARPYIERSVAANQNNAYAAHAMAHVCYELGEADAGRLFMRGWLAGYPSGGGLRGHLSWHQALWELQAGDVEAAMSLYAGAVTADPYPGVPQIRVLDTTSLLWRAELAGHGRDAALWREAHAYAERHFPHAGVPAADWHIALAELATGDEEGFRARLAAQDALLAERRLIGGQTVAKLSRAFALYARGDYAAAIPLLEEASDGRDCLGGSRAQTDVVEFTLLRALVLAGREAEAHDFIATRRREGPAGAPVAGITLQ